MDHVTFRPGGSTSRREPLDPGPLLAATEITYHFSSHALAGTAGRRRTLNQVIAESRTSEFGNSDNKPAKLPAFNQRLEQSFAALPGVQSVGLALYSTLEGNNRSETVQIEGRSAPGPNDDNGSSWDRVSTRFFETVGQPLIQGRGFSDSDTASSKMVAVVNQTFVKKFFPKENPIGRHFGIYDHKYASAFEIVGIVADAKYTNPRDEVRPMYFRPLTQELKGINGYGRKSVPLHQFGHPAF